MVEGNFISKINKLSRQLNAISRRETRTTELSDITNDLGDIRMGRFIALSTGDEPTDANAAGVVMDAAGQSFGGEVYNLYGVNAGQLQFGIKASDGQAVFLGGNAAINADGIDVTDSLKWIIRQTATNSTYTRVAKIGMAIPSGEDTPALELSLSSPAGSELVSNGDFETGDFTNWTKTTETNGAWEITADAYDGSYAALWNPAPLGDGNVKALLHFDGGDGSNTITDETGRTWTARGNAQLDTAQKVFGTASLLLDGNGDYVDTPDSEDFNVGSGDFEIECRVRFNAIDKTQYICGQGNSTGSNSPFVIYLESTNSIYARIFAYNLNSARNSIVANTWYIISFSREGETAYLRINGETIDTYNVGTITANNSSSKFSIGRNGEYDSSYFNGWIDEFIFVKGRVIHEADYTPAVAAYGALTLSTGVLTSDRMACTAALNYALSLQAKATTTDGTKKAEVKWYDDPAAGSLLQTDIIGTIAAAGSWQGQDVDIAAPTGAQSAAIVLTCNESKAAEVTFDDISMSEVSVNSKLQIRDDGLYFDGSQITAAPTINYARQAAWTWREAVTSVVIDTFYPVDAGPLNGGWRNTTANAADGDEYYFYPLLDTGTYKLTVIYSKYNYCGKIDTYLNGSTIDTAWDTYNSTQQNNLEKIITGITVSTAGRQEIKFKVNGKNASSSDYVIFVQQVIIRRTGD